MMSSEVDGDTFTCCKLPELTCRGGQRGTVLVRINMVLAVVEQVSLTRERVPHASLKFCVLVKLLRLNVNDLGVVRSLMIILYCELYRKIASR